MTPERWQEIKHLVNEALSADADARTTLLQQSCADDFALRIGAEALLSITRKLPEQPLAPDQWQRIEQLFQAALELEPTKRPAFLAQACDGDENLRHEVESLLVYQGAAGGLIQGAVHEAAGLLPNDEKARFTPGTTLNKRYRILGQLGKGGMGEVYRADDLKLGQPVALKFLTEKLSHDKAMLARFHSEVAMAHRVTHPNVCRVHDISEVTTSAGTLHFLSMEYVDGEDLSSLLRRIGRLPSDKAVEIANQLCAGLAAAHEAGVLHRDLKPANVMIDGKGRVRITDFGLAGFAEQIKGREVMAGTPAYMSPEQFAGKEVTTKSDIYALGLVLYEVFTGKRVFEAGSLEELKRMHESSAPTTPSSWVKDIDPLVERVILRCLEKDPAKRLASAKQVADALPGGDPLAAALALGETPSPEMVAAAGSKTGMKPMYAVACLLAIIVGLFVFAFLQEKAIPVLRLLRQNSPEELSHKARDLTRQIGYADRPADSAYGYSFDADYLQYQRQEVVPEKRRERFAKGKTSLVFWYRQSPQYLQSWFDGWIRDTDPPPLEPGLATVWLDLQGRLLQFEAVPPQVAQPRDVALPDWKPLFAAAGLDPSTLSSSEPQWASSTACDLRLAWTGHHPDFPELPLRIEAATFQGKPVYFHLIWPWTRPSRMSSATTVMNLGTIVIFVLFSTLSIGALLLAHHNFRQGRGDRSGAFRLAILILVVQFLSWLLGAHHVPDSSELFGVLLQGISPALLWASLAWVTYLALEPYVRKRWPAVLISWSRLLSGSLRDPLVCRDLLIGLAFGVGAGIFDLIHRLADSQQIYGITTPALYSLPGIRFLIATNLDFLRLYTIASLIALFLLFLLRTITRRQWLAAAIFVLIAGIIGTTGISPLKNGIYFGLLYLLFALVLLRFGFLAFVVITFTQSPLAHPITLHFSAWYSGSALVIVSAILVLAIYAFRTTLGGQKVFTGKLLEE